MIGRAMVAYDEPDITKPTLMMEEYSTMIVSQNTVMSNSSAKQTEDKSIHGDWQYLDNQAHVLTESKAASVCNCAFDLITYRFNREPLSTVHRN